MIKYYEFTNPVTNEITKLELTIDELTPENEEAIEEFFKLTKKDYALYPEFTNTIEEEYDGLLSKYFRINLTILLEKDLDVKEMLNIEVDDPNEPFVRFPRNTTDKKYYFFEEIKTPELLAKRATENEIMNLYSEYNDSQRTLGQEIKYWNQILESEEYGLSWFREGKYNNEKTLARPKTLLEILKSSKDDLNTPFSDTDVYKLYKDTLSGLNKEIHGK